MPPSKNEIAATLTRSEAARAGVLDGVQVQETITTNAKKLYGFTRKMVPKDLPTEPKLYIYSISEYGEIVDLGPGFQKFEIVACPEGESYGPPCVINPIYFFEEAKVDVTEHTFTSGKQIVDAILKIGPGMNAAWDRRKIGWFVSETDPPSKEEVKRAVEIYTAECQRLLTEGNRHAAAGHLNEINETHRRSAKYLGQRVDWDKPTRKMVDCVGCQERIPAGTVMHAVPYCGAVQPGRWPDAVALGMKRLEDVPPGVDIDPRRPKPPEPNKSA
ncbi:hypothetical protein KGP36_03325 [Patescibacteria group bacterium]|nr:hypothetical protein [Patescibacteria group bacterium]